MESLECGTGEGRNGQEPSVELIFKMLYLLGFWPDEEPTPTVETYSRYFGPRLARLLARSRVLRGALQFTRSFMPWNLMIFCALHILIVHPVDIYLSWGNKLHVIEDLDCILAYTVIFVGMISLYFQKERCFLLVRQHQSIYKDNIVKKGEVKSILDGTLVLSTNITKGCLLVSLGIAITTILAAFGYYLPNRMLVFRGWYPFNNIDSPYFEITLCIWVLDVIMLLFSGNTFISLGAKLVLEENMQFEILLYQLRNIHTISLENIRSRKKPVEAARMLAINNWRLARCLLNPPLPVSNIIPGCVDLETHHNLAEEGGVVSETHPQSDVTSNLQSTQSRRCDNVVIQGTGSTGEESCKIEESDDTHVRITRIELDNEMQLELVELVKLHQTCFGLKLSWESFWEVFYICNYITNVLLFAITTILVTTVVNLSLKECVSICVWLQVLGLNFMCNYFLNTITTQSAAVSEALYACDWLEASPRFKRAMLIIMTRANVPLEFKPTGIDPFSPKNFTEMANVAYKMLAATSTIVSK